MALIDQRPFIAHTTVLSSTVHSFVDGLVMAGAFSASSSVGARVGLAIILHKFPDGFVLSTILAQAQAGQRHQTRSTSQLYPRSSQWQQQLPLLTFRVSVASLYWILGVCAMTPLGAFLGSMALGGIPPLALGFVLGFGSGTFLYITCVGIVPELTADKNHRLLSLACLALGYAMFLLSDSLFHAH